MSTLFSTSKHNKRVTITRIIVLCTLSTSIYLTGCKKFLEMPLRDKVPQEALFTDEQGFMDAMTGVYLAMDKPGSTTGNGLYTHDLTMGMVSILANNYPNASSSSLNSGVYANISRYDYEQSGVKQEIGFVWSAMYHNIANLNNMLSFIDDKKDVFSRDNYDRIKGEALALRALFHFDLVRLFGPVPATGLSSTSIPYVRKFGAEPGKFIPLNTFLDSCITDLNQAKDYLAKTDTSAIIGGSTDLFKAYTQNHMNYWAAKSLLARVYLYRGDHAMALKMAQEVIGSQKFPLSTSNVAVATAPVRDRLFSKEHIFSVFSTQIGLNSEAIFNGSSGTPLQLPATNKNAIYGTTAPLDWRLSWFDNNARNFNVPSKFFQNSNLPYIMQNIAPVIRITELYYIAAEAASQMGNLQDGLRYLNLARVARGLNPLTNINDAIALNNEVGKEYKKEFIQEGQTFFYYKRLNKDLKIETGTTNAVPANAYVFPIPDKELENNPQ